MKWCCATVTDDECCIKRLKVQSVITNTSTWQVMNVQRNSEARSCNHCYSGKVISITHSECACVAVGTQHAMRMRHNVIRGLPRYTTFFHFISYKPRFSLEEKKLLNTKCVLNFTTTSVCNITHSNKKWARCDQRRIPVFKWSTSYYCQVLLKFQFYEQIFEKKKNTRISTFMKTCLVGAELFHTDGHTRRR
jgi:hypothetical protein